MIYKWESRDERLLRFMHIPPKKKLEWLRRMQIFLNKSLTGKRRDIYYKLRREK